MSGGFFIAVTLACGGQAQGQLAWAKTEETFNASATQDVYIATYPFVNNGTRPVEIRDIKTTCGCTTADLEKRVYAPGEGGELSVAFRLRGRRGEQDKRIRVRTDDPASDVELRLAGMIEDVAKVTPIFLLWRRNAAADWQTSTIRIREGAGMRVTSVVPSSDNFEFKFEERAPGAEYELAVKPRTGTEREDICVFQLTLVGDKPADPQQTVYVHARIK